jgi:hypothetical protein
MKRYERLSLGLGELQFYFEIEKLVENMLIYTSLDSGLGKCSIISRLRNW